MINQEDLEKELRIVLRSKLDNALKDDEIFTVTTNIINELVEEKINNVLNHILNNKANLTKFGQLIDEKYNKKIQDLVDLEVKTKVSNTISKIDLGSEISSRLHSFISERIKNFNLPDASIPAKAISTVDLKIDAGMIESGVYEKFTSTGIQDVANNIELTVADNFVVVEHTLAARNCQIEDTVISKNIIADTITINGELKLSAGINKEFSGMIKNHINDAHKTLKIDVVVNPIVANDKIILSNTTLGPSVINSNLRKLGRLTELSVSGFTNINDTLVVTESNRIGINTETPEGALTIWDDDSELSIKKYRKKTMYVGSTRDCDLVLGAGNDSKIEIRRDGVVYLNILSLGGIQLSASDNIPDHNGSPGDIVFIKKPAENTPWGYRCLGSNVWKAL